MAYWVTFEDGYAGCIETFGAPDGQTSDERSAYLAEYINQYFQYSWVKDHGKAVSVQSLPYPANPRLMTISYLGSGPCPSFCMQPKQCAGKSSCPRSYSCVD